MNKTLTIVLCVAAGFGIGFATSNLLNSNSGGEKTSHKKDKTETKKEEKKSEPNLPPESKIKVGAFSMSLNVKDLEASKKFYETLGFTTDMDIKSGYLIMKNGNSLIGIFSGFFEGNMLTFNPGWDENGKELEKFNDVRELHKLLTDAGYKIEEGAVLEGSGPGYFNVKDPDGNMILFDQHR